MLSEQKVKLSGKKIGEEKAAALKVYSKYIVSKRLRDLLQLIVYCSTSRPESLLRLCTVLQIITSTIKTILKKSGRERI